MSLLSGMNDMMTNHAAMEAAEDEIMFSEDIAMEADELIDTMVDAKKINANNNDDIEQMMEEDEEEDEINRELDDEDNSIGAATEAAALTGNDFLASLFLDKDDPITTHSGSYGYQDSAATFDKNFADAFDDNDDPIKTHIGSYGYQDSAATFDKNFSDAFDDDDDPIKVHDGSYGASATAKDPVLESAIAFEAFIGDKIVDKVKAKRASNRLKDLNKIGISKDIPSEKIDALVSQGKFDAAINVIKSWVKSVESAKKKVMDADPEAKKKRKIADRMIKSATSASISIEIQKATAKYEKNGMSHKDAKKKAKAEFKEKAKKADAVNEAYIMECIGMIEAFEAATGVDPEATSDGAIGQDDSKASFNGNFSDGLADDNDPISTIDGAEGQDDSAATFDNNFSGGFLDKDDPIEGIDGSIGQKNSTAKDPAIESTIDDELESLNGLLNDMEDDDLF